MKKLRIEQAESEEISRLSEALGSCLELTDAFLEEAFSEDLQEILAPLSCEDRALALSGCVGEGYFVGTVFSPTKSSIFVYMGEIEIQLPPGATPEEYLEEPEEWLCERSLCYYSPGYGVVFEVNIEQLKDNIKEARRRT